MVFMCLPFYMVKINLWCTNFYYIKNLQNAPVPGSKPNVTPKPGGTKAAPATERPPKTELKDHKASIYFLYILYYL